MYNIVHVSDMLLGESLNTRVEARKWLLYYTYQYPGQHFAIVSTDVKRTAPLPGQDLTIKAPVKEQHRLAKYRRG